MALAPRLIDAQLTDIVHYPLLLAFIQTPCVFLLLSIRQIPFSSSQLFFQGKKIRGSLFAPSFPQLSPSSRRSDPFVFSDSFCLEQSLCGVYLSFLCCLFLSCAVQRTNRALSSQKSLTATQKSIVGPARDLPSARYHTHNISLVSKSFANYRLLPSLIPTVCRTPEGA